MCSSSGGGRAREGVAADEVRRHVGPEACAQEPLEELQPLSRVKRAVVVHTRAPSCWHVPGVFTFTHCVLELECGGALSPPLFPETKR